MEALPSSVQVRPVMSRIIGILVVGAALAFPLLLASPAKAVPRLTDRDSKPALGFSNLVVRLDSEDRIGMATQDFRIHILESLRAGGFNAVGAESLVFGKDHSQRADFLLGGIIRELECVPGAWRCRIGVEWQLLDVEQDVVVYSVLTRFSELSGRYATSESMGNVLVLGALHSLVQRPRFSERLQKIAPSRGESVHYPLTSFRRCDAVPAEMPANAENILAATVLVQSGHGFGSGFLLSNDALVLTAAHVITSSDLTVRMRDGTSRRAVLIRVNRAIDAALLQLPNAGDAPMPCLGLSFEKKAIGSEVYAIGSPASQTLSFSLTRGIISGVRNIDGASYLQTDASISPGNSGGPLIDKQGKVLGIMSWKIAGASVAGLAFGIPIEDALRGLSLLQGSNTDDSLEQPDPTAATASKAAKPEVDAPDPKVSIDPEGDKYRAEMAREERRKELTPGYIGVMRWGGVIVGGTGLLVAATSYAKYDEASTTHDEFNSLVVRNTVGWVGFGLGTASFVLSFVLIPKLPKDASNPTTGTPRATIAVSPDGQVRLGTSF